jgi:hypothetical protein
MLGREKGPGREGGARTREDGRVAECGVHGKMGSDVGVPETVAMVGGEERPMGSSPPHMWDPVHHFLRFFYYPNMWDLVHLTKLRHLSPD